jgi:cardiolipin synthase
LTGDGAWSLTLIFLRLWNVEAYFSRKYPIDDFAAFFPVVDERERVVAGGFVQPYADSPISKEYICEKVYLHLINSAQDYMYISTPYLILDEAVLSALLIAAKSGTDVRIITPHRGDKPLVQMVTRSFYRQLIHGGVRVYEYTAGFNHAKTFVCDDSMATVGTANLDFRSLYHDYECAVFLYNTPAVRAIKDDFVKTLASCVEIREEDCARNAFFRVTQDVARLFGPLM